jgi:hypothetical protein
VTATRPDLTHEQWVDALVAIASTTRRFGDQIARQS